MTTPTGSPPAATDYLANRPEVHQSSWWSPFGQVARRLREAVDLLSEPSRAGPSPTVVDFGCAETPYRDLFADGTYLGADLAGNPRAQITLRPDGTVPLPDGAADLVLSTQVLEHVEDPTGYLAECWRLLRPGGRLVLSTHGIVYLHRDPTDYWRWTCDGLVKIVEDAGFDVEDLRGVLGLVGASLQLLQAGVARRVPPWLRGPLVVAFQVAIAAAERLTSDASRRDNALVYAVAARKPSDLRA